MATIYHYSKPRKPYNIAHNNSIKCKKVAFNCFLHNLSVLNLNMAVAKLYLEYFRFKMAENKMAAMLRNSKPTKPYNRAL
jgi:hypothetical protein